MPSESLPESWSEEKDPLGRTFYIDHRTKSTTWDRPAVAPSSRPPPYHSTAAASQHHLGQDRPPPCVCTPRITFWVTAALSWIVWIFAVSASADDHWFEDAEFFSAADDRLLDLCSDGALQDRFCARFRAFSAMQLVAIILLSFSVLLLMIAMFRPAVGRCCSARALGLGGGALMAAYVLFQVLAFVLVIVIEKTEEFGADFNGNPKLGATFGVAVVASVLALLEAGILFTCIRGSGDGPFYKCVHGCLAMNNSTGTPTGQTWNHVTAPASTVPPAAVATAAAAPAPPAPSAAPVEEAAATAPSAAPAEEAVATV